jgi:antitoxin (DNA-binding transcriptional repressor) of toxin-antitoxin stability system
MDATILDLRYKMRDVLTALNRHEKVTIKYHGKTKGIIIPHGTSNKRKSSEHPLFGMLKDETESPAELVNKMRRSR